MTRQQRLDESLIFVAQVKQVEELLEQENYLWVDKILDDLMLLIKNRLGKKGVVAKYGSDRIALVIKKKDPRVMNELEKVREDLKAWGKENNKKLNIEFVRARELDPQRILPLKEYLELTKL